MWSGLSGKTKSKMFIEKLRNRESELVRLLSKLLLVISATDSHENTSIAEHLAYYYAAVVQDVGLESEILPTIAKIQLACKLLEDATCKLEALVALKKWLVKSKRWLDIAEDPWIKVYALKTHMFGLYLRALVLREADKDVGFLLKTQPSHSQVGCQSDDQTQEWGMSKQAMCEAFESVLSQTEVRSTIKVELQTEGFWWGGKFYNTPPYGVSLVKNRQDENVRQKLLYELVYIANTLSELPPHSTAIPVCDPDLDGGIYEPLTQLPIHILRRQHVQFRIDSSIKNVCGQLRPRRCLVFAHGGSSGEGIGAMMALVMNSVRNSG